MVLLRLGIRSYIVVIWVQPKGKWYQLCCRLKRPKNKKGEKTQDTSQLAVFLTCLFNFLGGFSLCSGTLQGLFKSAYVSPHLCILPYTCQHSICSHRWCAVPLRACECSAGCVRHRKEMGGYDQATLLWYTMEAVKGAEQGLAQLWHVLHTQYKG